MKEFIESKNYYGKYFIPSNVVHRPCAKTILAGDVWEFDTVSYIINNVKEDSIIHCGTFFGDMLPAFSKNVKKTVYAFEPNPLNFKAAKKTIKANKLKNVKILNAGLGEKNDIGYLNIGSLKNAGGTSHFRKKEKILETDIKQKLVTIDSIVKEKISLIHLDIEGFEINALKGAKNIITRDKPILVLEELEYTNDTFWNFIENLGYKYFKKVNANHIWKVN